MGRTDLVTAAGGLNLAFSDDVRLVGDHHFPDLYNLRETMTQKILMSGISASSPRKGSHPVMSDAAWAECQLQLKVEVH